ncbi:Glycosyl hydrolases family 2, sugar binding domain [Brevundimonas sp. SH203]|uniref:sialate O-acetylesterase n=1 Tax=Brevundimonas sp. SH203 TaxID=345167 RepID=UPI0009CB7CDA|nr:sialate O-acetylesterase [Brevundimonas sp. SH203]GAW42294.1 Glycosyl hydrolases family 2, sugar binding domain [Brevundimonas sp. SH203]
MRSFLLAAVATAVLATAVPALAQAPSAPLLDSMFQDHAVLQRGRPITVWGRAAPGAPVSVSLGQTQVQATAGPDGAWRASLPTLTAGGPYVLTARSGDTTQSVSDVMVGDVWLCSGQSNMEFAVRQATNADTEIAGANDPNLRLFLVGRSSLSAPAAAPRAVGQWRTTSPASVRDFSAACYFMGRDLRRTEGVPVGLIAASWGGSIIEDWLSREAIQTLGGHDQALNALDAYARDPAQGDAIWRRVTQDWWAANDPGTKQGWNLPRTPDADWAPIPAEGFWESTVPGLETFDGVVWLRNTVQLTAAQARQAAMLELGPVDDADVTWVNGRYVGGQQGWDTPRKYAVPAGALKPGANLIAVGVLDTNGGGGAWGPAANKRLVLADGTIIPLSSGWRHRVAAPLSALPNPPRTPWIGGSGTTTLYNGMIAPLGAYALKGMAWYQGESNIGDPAGYRRLLPALFADWRRRFDSPDMRALVVQLANFGPAATQPTNSAWAALRESQRAVVDADPLAGLAVAIDIGDRYDIHPTNKLEVGRRLALEARRLDGQTQPVSPQPVAVTRAADGVHVRYSASARLVAHGSNRPVGFELCGAADACRFVDATLAGDEVVLASAAATDLKVRFCWADSPVCNLYGPAGLPAVPFEAEIR